MSRRRKRFERGLSPATLALWRLLDPYRFGSPRTPDLRTRPAVLGHRARVRAWLRGAQAGGRHGVASRAADLEPGQAHRSDDDDLRAAHALGRLGRSNGARRSQTGPGESAELPQ